MEHKGALQKLEQLLREHVELRSDAAYFVNSLQQLRKGETQQATISFAEEGCMTKDIHLYAHPELVDMLLECATSYFTKQFNQAEARIQDVAEAVAPIFTSGLNK